jgi:hypothetical protein
VDAVMDLRIPEHAGNFLTEPWIQLLSEAVFVEVKCAEEINACLVNHILPPSLSLGPKLKSVF